MLDINSGSATRLPVSTASATSTSGVNANANVSAGENKVVNIRQTERQQTADVSTVNKKFTLDLPATSEQLKTKVNELNQNAVVRRSLQFSVDEGTGTTVITVRDAVTDEVIRQIPSEELVALAKRLKELDMSLDGEKGVLLTAQA